MLEIEATKEDRSFLGVQKQDLNMKTVNRVRKSRSGTPKEEIICLGAFNNNQKPEHQNQKIQMQSTPKSKEVESPKVQSTGETVSKSQIPRKIKNSDSGMKPTKIPEASKPTTTTETLQTQKVKNQGHSESQSQNTTNGNKSLLRPHLNKDISKKATPRSDSSKKPENPSPGHNKRKYGENTEKILHDCVEDLMETIPDTKGWSSEVKKEVTHCLKSLVVEETKGKMVSPVTLEDDDLVEVTMTFNKIAYDNLLKGNLPLINVDPETGKDLSEISFSQNIINRVKKNDGGHQEFRIRLDENKRYEAAKARPGQEGAFEQCFELLGGFDIMSTNVSKKDESEASTGAMSRNWENKVQALRIYTEKMLKCFDCEKIVKEEIGVHLTLEHWSVQVQAWNKPVRNEKGRMACGICGIEIASMGQRQYLIHSTFAHGALYELNKSLDLNLDGGIAQALFDKSEEEERRQKRKAQQDHRGVKRQRSTSIGKERNVAIENRSVVSQDQLKMAQKIKSYKKLTEKEIQVITKEIPLRRSTMVEKDELKNAVKKMLTKLHLIYTIGVNEVPQEYTTIRNSLTSNINRLYGREGSGRVENMWEGEPE